MRVRAGQSLSLQYHEMKDESWLVQQGRASLELGALGGDLEPATDRDVRDGRLGGNPQGCPLAVHSGAELVDTRLHGWAVFVDKSVDPVHTLDLP
jgi:mannose-6-phosphate isomerase-like protein (cupin superfamily)